MAGWTRNSTSPTRPTSIALSAMTRPERTGRTPARAGSPTRRWIWPRSRKRWDGPPGRPAVPATFASGGAPYAKHGDLEPALADPPADFDMHMGTLKMRCQDCHATTEHRIAGMSMSAPAVEGRVRCEKCHGQTPHGVAGMLSRHLDDHVRAVACETCHIPFIAKAAPTLLRRDYSQGGPGPSASGWTSTGCRSTTRNSGP